MDEKHFFIHITWEVKSSVIVDANSLDEAIKVLEDNFGSYLPDDYEYDFGSVEIEPKNCYEYKD